MDRWTGERTDGRTDGLTHDETEKRTENRRGEEVKWRNRGDKRAICCNSDLLMLRKIFIQMHLPPVPCSPSKGELFLSSDMQAGFPQLLESDRFFVCGVEYPSWNYSVAFEAEFIHASRVKTSEGERVVFHARLGAN